MYKYLKFYIRLNEISLLPFKVKGIWNKRARNLLV